MIILFFMQLFIFTSLQALLIEPDLEWNDLEKVGVIDPDWEWGKDENSGTEQTVEELCKTVMLLKLHSNHRYDPDGLESLNLSRKNKQNKWRNLEKALKTEIELTKACIGNENIVQKLFANKELKNRIRLKSLDLSYNQFEELPDTISQLTTLTHLDVSYNKLISIPEVIGCLTKLKKLNVDNNQLECFPPDIGKLIQLKQLSFTENQDLKSLPHTMTQLKALVSLKGIGIGFECDLPEFNFLPADLEHLPDLDNHSIRDIKYRRNKLEHK